MCFIAAMRRPLRSKLAMTSPVRPRSNASGFTRIRVRSKGASQLSERQVVSGRGRGGGGGGVVGRRMGGSSGRAGGRAGRRAGGSSGLGRAAGCAAVGSSMVERVGGRGRGGRSRSGAGRGLGRSAVAA